MLMCCINKALFIFNAAAGYERVETPLLYGPCMSSTPLLPHSHTPPLHYMTPSVYYYCCGILTIILCVVVRGCMTKSMMPCLIEYNVKSGVILFLVCCHRSCQLRKWD